MIADGATIRISGHARDEMAKDNLTYQDVHYAMKGCMVVAPGHDGRSGEQRWLLRGRTVDGVQVAMVVELPDDDPPVIVTVTVYKDEGRRLQK